MDPNRAGGRRRGGNGKSNALPGAIPVASFLIPLRFFNSLNLIPLIFHREVELQELANR